ncbi:hypothetical protein QFZ53_001501 [Microbacterium natoriense]|uniref:Uncharacterized protein n=1 Tax=Microbacterium natoriense TaxID=284570 RepID=A0AAW8EV37_9MICO|nr:hypothetical protein [Microbacterium natoriense]MDQ0647305.1 hypothetical protein [Microbacterium natoriense]
MPETEHQRNIRKTREAAEATAVEAARSAVWQAESAYQSQRAADAAEAAAAAQRQTQFLQAQALDEQRRAAFALWRQSPDGQAFDRWSRSAHALIAQYDANTAAFDAAWQRERKTAIDAITAGEREQFSSGIYVDGRPQPVSHANANLYALCVLFAAGSIVLFAIMGVSALFMGGHSIFGAEWPLAALGASAATFVWGLALSAHHPEWKDERARGEAAAADWTERNTQARNKASADRRARFDFDPLEDLDWQPRPWTSTPHPGRDITDFTAIAYTGFPRADQLPALPVIAVRDPDSEPLLGLREVLRNMTTQ